MIVKIGTYMGDCYVFSFIEGGVERIGLDIRRTKGVI